MTNSIKTSSIISLLIAVCSFSSSKAQITVTLGSGTSATQTNSTGPSPYNTNADNRIMQFVYTASEIKAAGGSEGDILSIAWKVKDTTTMDMPDYGVWMKNTKARDVSSHDNRGLKLVKGRHNYKHGKPGWQTMRLDSNFYWDEKNNLLVQVCFGTISSTTAKGTVFIYNNTANQRRGTIGKGSVCGLTSTTAYNWKPFIQLVIDPVCSTPTGITFSNVTTSSAVVTWNSASSGAEGYEYIVRNTSGDPTGSGTYTTDTSLKITGLCPGKLTYFYIRSLCGKGDTSDWSRANIFQTKTGGGISTNSPICAENDLLMWVETAQSYSWSGPGGFSSTTQKPEITAAQAGHSGTYVVSILDTNSCTVTYSAYLRVDSLPIVRISHNAPLCADEHLKVVASGGSKYRWTGPEGFQSDTSVIDISSAKVTDAGYYHMYLENSFGCTDDDSVFIDINELPDFTTSSNTPICAGDSLKLNVSGSYSYSWWGPKGFQSTDQNPLLVSTTTANQGKYFVRASTQKGCTTNDTLDVVVNPLPSVVITGSLDVCDSELIKLTATGADFYSWELDGNFLSDSSTIFKAKASTSDAGTYKVTGFDNNGCFNSDERVIQILPLPISNIIVADSVCEGEYLTLLAQTDGISFSWTGPSGFTGDQLADTILGIQPNQSGLYTFIATGSNGCQSTTAHSVLVLPKPNISIVKQGNNLLASAGFGAYTWYKDGIEITGIVGRILTVNEIGSYTVKVVGVNACYSTSDAVDVTSLGVIELPARQWTLFPNPATAQIELISSYPLGNVKIYDSQGKVVYSANTTMKTNLIPITDFAKGVYFVQVKNEMGVSHKSFVRQ